jgi:predicted TIM-barrel fold metal-dependent hydrolase
MSGYGAQVNAAALTAEDRAPTVEQIADYCRQRQMAAGQTGIGAGLPGGRGIKLRLSNPMLLDDVEVRPKILKDNAARLLGLTA